MANYTQLACKLGVGVCLNYTTTDYTDCFIC